jgi:hypothetical protein
LAHVIGNVEGNKEAQGESALARNRRGEIRLPRIQEVAAHGIERGLRGLPAYAFTEASELASTVQGAVRSGEPNVDEADRFLARATPGAGDAGDTDTEGGAGPSTNSLSQGSGNFGTNGTLCSEQ